MSRVIAPLSEAACRSAKPIDRAYKLFDGDGLYLLAQPNGRKGLEVERLLTEGIDEAEIKSRTCPADRAATKTDSELRTTGTARSNQMLFEKRGQLVEGNLVHSVVQIDMVRVGHNQQFLRLGGCFVNVFGVIAGMGVFAGD